MTPTTAKLLNHPLLPLIYPLADMLLAVTLVSVMDDIVLDATRFPPESNIKTKFDPLNGIS
jgi:hypothetical protein